MSPTIPTLQNCPTCRDKGVTARLSRELGAELEYFCPKGHRFAEVPKEAESVAVKVPTGEYRKSTVGVHKLANGTPEAAQGEAEHPAKPATTSAEEIVRQEATERESGPSEAHIVLIRLEAELEQVRVQLAGCLVAAEGATRDLAKQGDYGWSPAYQAVLDLRQKYDALDIEYRGLRAQFDELQKHYYVLADALECTKKGAMTEASSTGQVQAPMSDRPIASFHPTSTALPGGEALVIIRLSESAVDALRVEAENQGRRWEEYFQSQVAYAIEQRGGVF